VIQFSWGDVIKSLVSSAVQVPLFVCPSLYPDTVGLGEGIRGIYATVSEGLSPKAENFFLHKELIFVFP